MQIQKHAFGESVSLVNVFALKRQIHLTTDRLKFNKPNFSIMKSRIHNRIIAMLSNARICLRRNGKVVTTSTATCGRQDEKGSISDSYLIEWKGRELLEKFAGGAK